MIRKYSARLLSGVPQVSQSVARDSRWRSPSYQDQLLREVVSTYGSEDEAARWVATAATPPHVCQDPGMRQ